MVLQIRIYGRVQGVYYRASTQEYARSLGLVGWVKNRADGSVELVAYDSHTPTTSSNTYVKLQSWCQQGPTHARVTHIESTWLDIQQDWSEFLILRA